MTRTILTACLLLGPVSAAGAETPRAAEAIAASLKRYVSTLSRPVYTYHSVIELPAGSPLAPGFDARSYMEARIARHSDLSIPQNQRNTDYDGFQAATDPVTGSGIGERNSKAVMEIVLDKGFRFADVRQWAGSPAELRVFSEEIRRLLRSEDCEIQFPERLFIEPGSQSCRAVAVEAARILDVDGVLYSFAVKPLESCPNRTKGAFMILNSRALATERTQGRAVQLAWSDAKASDTAADMSAWMRDHIFGCGQYPEDADSTPSADSYSNAAALFAETGRVDRAIELYRQALTLDPDFVPALDELAWIRATHPDAAFRNPAEAEHIAQHLLDVVMHKLGRPGSKEHVGRTYKIRASQTVAAAFAANGNYGHAVECAQSSLETAQRLNEIEPSPQTAQLLAQAAEQLKLYQEGRPLLTPAGSRRSPVPVGK